MGFHNDPPIAKMYAPNSSTSILCPLFFRARGFNRFVAESGRLDGIVLGFLFSKDEMLVAFPRFNPHGPTYRCGTLLFATTDRSPCFLHFIARQAEYLTGWR